MAQAVTRARMEPDGKDWSGQSALQSQRISFRAEASGWTRRFTSPESDTTGTGIRDQPPLPSLRSMASVTTAGSSARR
ncbi:MAG: hypothetical protein IJP66_01915 [Kiritimatiellae bacterium]|nr:hypothetical protein [Kiritimatiellia bacterium]